MCRNEFASDLGGAIEEVVIGAGPCGELRYPSYVEEQVCSSGILMTLTDSDAATNY